MAVQFIILKIASYLVAKCLKLVPKTTDTINMNVAERRYEYYVVWVYNSYENWGRDLDLA